MRAVAVRWRHWRVAILSQCVLEQNRGRELGRHERDEGPYFKIFEEN